MKKIFESELYGLTDEEGSVEEKIYVYAFDNADEADDFSILSHNEQLAELGFKENSTPSSNKGKVNRYFLDASDFTLIVRQTTIAW